MSGEEQRSEDRKQPGILGKAWGLVRSLFSIMNQAHRGNAAELTQFEARELENVFVLVLMGSFMGMPSPPSSLSIELLPYMEHELRVLNRKAERSTDALAEVSSILNID
ncbi:MAG: hypothetical protein ACLFPO_02720 [Spirochaetaceae bacterium]